MSSVTVLSLVSATEDDQNIYITMPYYEKGSINSLIDKEMLSTREILKYSIDFLSGLMFLHIKELVHLYIKPTNVMLNDSNRAISTDFGLSRYLNENGLANQEFQYRIHRSPESFNNLNILNLDVTYTDGKLKLTPFTEQSLHISRNPSLLVNWLIEHYPSVGELYKKAIENYIDGEAVSCISNCRNIITGVFSHNKDDGNRSWTKGLQNLSTDTNIENINAPNNIMQDSANKGITFENDNVFKYPRFKLIYHLYSLTSDLGSHSTEAPKIDGTLFLKILHKMMHYCV